MSCHNDIRPERPDLYSRLTELSRAAFGGHDAYFPYTIMWPFVIARLEALPPGSRVLDLGAGITPLPLFLAQIGAHVDTVDNHPTERTLPFDEHWNGWGFFDYRALHPHLTSHHCSVADFTTSQRFDAVYSLGLIAHLPHDVRAALVARCAQWLNPRGDLLLAIDLIPSSDFLWNRCEGREVEPPTRHGSVDSVLDELAAQGLTMRNTRIVRSLPQARTDLLLIHAAKA
jgi:cyclopropane fatty-acyl-phospholipid synthase-like methyltransferase